MTQYGMMPDFTGLSLVVPDKPDIERDAVAKAWEEHGGNVVRIGRFWEPPELEREKVCLYGNHVFCMILAQKLNLKLLSPTDDLLINMRLKWIKRKVGISSILEAENLIYPCFVKPLIPKVFTAGKYDSYSELLKECTQLEGATPIIYSDIVDICAEVRSFVLNGKVLTASVYEGEADINSAEHFLKEFVLENSNRIPSTCVIDIGYIADAGWAVVEANAVWGAGLNGCDPLGAAVCIEKATRMG
ncbi:MAG: ATP-grasp domain-containing protein [Clostridia bacterium]|nr:ATP-grasp domain-containing protein [Clostridia bacterium]